MKWFSSLHMLFQMESFSKNAQNNDWSSELIMYRMLLQHCLKNTFVNVELSFSKLKRIKDETLLTMKQDRLYMLPLKSVKIMFSLQ